MIKIIRKLFFIFLLLFSNLPLNSCANKAPENVMIKRIYIENEDHLEPRMLKKKNNNGILNTEAEVNFTVLYTDEIDISLTIEVEKPENYRIESLLISCTDPNAKIMENGIYEPINKSNGKRLIEWHGENNYKTTYNIRIESKDFLNTFIINDVKLRDHDLFQSEEGVTDFGNNELDIYKIKRDAYSINVVENSFDKLVFNFNISDEYKDIISNFKVDDQAMNSDGNWVFTESKISNVSYDILGKDSKIVRNTEEIEMVLLKTYYWDCPDAIVKSAFYPEDNVCIEVYELTFGFDGVTHNGIRLFYDSNELEIFRISKFAISFICDDIFEIDYINDDFYTDLKKHLDLFTLEVNAVKYKLVYEVSYTYTDEEVELVKYPKHKYKIIGLEEVI